MPDIRNAMQKAGLPGSPAERKCERCGKLFVPREAHYKVCSECFGKESSRARGPQFAARGLGFLRDYPDYPAYFDDTGVLRCDYLTKLAKEWARTFGAAKPKLTTHQLRAFYQHVKRQQAAVKNGRPFREVLVEICKLKPFARERAEKETIPAEFEEFVSLNVDKVKDQKTFLEGFVEHFQAIVAYCAGTIQKR